MDAADRRARGVRAGVCVVRAEAQSDWLLITVTVDGDIAQNLRGAPLERVMRFANPDDALAAVGRFLQSFAPTGPSAG